MNKKRYFVTLLLAVVCSSSFSQPVKSQIQINDSSVHLVGDSVYIKFRVTAFDLSTNNRFEFKPILYKGTQRIILPMARISGRRNILSESRRQMSNIMSTEFFKGLSVRADQTLDYSTVIGYSEWMNSSSLRLDIMLKGCCETKLLAPMVVSSDLLLSRPVVVPISPSPKSLPILSKAQQLVEEETFLHSLDAYEGDLRNRAFFKDKGALRLYFPQGKDQIDLVDGENVSTLRRIDNALRVFASDSILRVSKVLIVGSTSIEGEVGFNSRLSARRAQRLVEISQKHGVSLRQIQVINLGEGWDELRHMVDTSVEDIPNRRDILYVIDNVSINGGRERRLMDLNGGIPYRWMLKHIFPYQRSTSYFKIYFEKR